MLCPDSFPLAYLWDLFFAFVMSVTRYLDVTTLTLMFTNLLIIVFYTIREYYTWSSCELYTGILNVAPAARPQDGWNKLLHCLHFRHAPPSCPHKQHFLWHVSVIIVNTLMGSLFMASLNVAPGIISAHKICAHLLSLVRFIGPPNIGHRQHI